jgi:uncharacterized membrane protein YgcG
MKIKKNSKLLFIFSLFIFSLTGLFALDNSMYVDSLHVSMDISEDNQYLINENYNFNYLSAHHGFFRVIPTDYAGSNFYVELKDIRCDEPFSVDRGNQSTTVKVGDADRTITGEKEYNLSYIMDIGKNYSEQAEGKTYAYYNLVGGSWDFPIKNVSFEIAFPKEIDPNDVSLTSGPFNSESYSGTVQISDDMKTIKGTVDVINPGEYLTLYVDLPVGYFSGERDALSGINRNFIILIALSIVALLFTILQFSKYGRDDDIIEVESFKAPDGMNPMDLGYFVDKVVDTKDTTAMLFYWADNGYIKIEEQDDSINKKKGKKEFLITKLKNLPSTCSQSEKMLFGAYFKNKSIGDSLLISSLKEKFVEDRNNAIAKEPNNFTGDKELVEPQSAKAKKKILGFILVLIVSMGFLAPGTDSFKITALSFLVAFLTYLLLSLLFSKLFNTSVTESKKKKLGIVIIIIIAIAFLAALNSIFYFAISPGSLGLKFGVLNIITATLISILFELTEKRSEYATKTYGDVLGFKSFINYVEIDKLKLLIDEDPMFFYHTLSYAIVLGLEKQWYKKFETIEIPNNPGFFFYAPIGMGIPIDSFNDLSSSVTSSVNSSIASVQSSSSGGSSGGGFGGGGGGGW